jgi:RNA polymerase sigma-70 factor, ECF subfamily
VKAVQDDEIHAGLLHREHTALSALMDKYVNPVYGLCARILAGIGSPQDIEECVSDAFYAAWQHAADYRPDRAPLRTWLLMQAKYTALQRRRQLTRQHEVPGSVNEEAIATEPLPDEALATAEERQRLHAAMNQLPSMDPELVYRRYFLEEKVSDLAETFGLTRQAADNRLWRARQSLRALLGLEKKGVELG